MGSKIKQLREALGLTQLELSQLSNVSRPTIIEIEKGTKTEVKMSTIRKLASALNCEPGELIF